MVRIIFGFLVFFSFSHPHISKIQLEKKIREIAVREKRPGFSKVLVFIAMMDLISLMILVFMILLLLLLLFLSLLFRAAGLSHWIF